MHSRQVDISPHAEREAREAFLWYVERNPLAAARFEREVVDAVSAIAAAPEQAPQLEPGIRRRLLRRFPYAIVYAVDQGRILLLAVAHLKRRPGYWKK